MSLKFSGLNFHKKDRNRNQGNMKLIVCGASLWNTQAGMDCSYFALCKAQLALSGLWELPLFPNKLLHFPFTHMIKSNYSQSCQIPPENQTMHWQLGLKMTLLWLNFPIIYFAQSINHLKSLYLISGSLHSGDFFFLRESIIRAFKDPSPKMSYQLKLKLPVPLPYSVFQ